MLGTTEVQAIREALTAAFSELSNSELNELTASAYAELRVLELVGA